MSLMADWAKVPTTAGTSGAPWQGALGSTLRGAASCRQGRFEAFPTKAKPARRLPLGLTEATPAALFLRQARSTGRSDQIREWGSESQPAGPPLGSRGQTWRQPEKCPSRQGAAL